MKITALYLAEEEANAEFEGDPHASVTPATPTTPAAEPRQNKMGDKLRGILAKAKEEFVNNPLGVIGRALMFLAAIIVHGIVGKQVGLGAIKPEEGVAAAKMDRKTWLNKAIEAAGMDQEMQKALDTRNQEGYDKLAQKFLEFGKLDPKANIAVHDEFHKRYLDMRRTYTPEAMKGKPDMAQELFDEEAKLLAATMKQLDGLIEEKSKGQKPDAVTDAPIASKDFGTQLAGLAFVAQGGGSTEIPRSTEFMEKAHTVLDVMPDEAKDQLNDIFHGMQQDGLDDESVKWLIAHVDEIGHKLQQHLQGEQKPEQQKPEQQKPEEQEQAKPQQSEEVSDSDIDELLRQADSGDDPDLGESMNGRSRFEAIIESLRID